jgi:hypothetical protein
VPQSIPPGTGGPGGLDGDGYESDTERAGFVLLSGITLAGGSYTAGSTTRVPPCSSASDPERVFCVHEDTSGDTKDLFAILHPLESEQSDSFFPSMSSITELKDFFSKVSAPSASGGLGVTVHPLKQDLPEYPNDPRLIADEQNAIRVVEDPDPLDLPITKKTQIDLGETTPGTPNSPGSGWIDVFSVRIKQYVCDLCGGDPDTYGNCDPPGNFHSDNCKSDSTSAYGDTLVGEYTRYVNYHETGHSILLVDPGDPGYPYHHAPGGDDSRIMTPSVTYTKRGGRVTFHLPDHFCSECASSFVLE